MPREFSINDFDIGRLLGEGGFGKVYYAVEKKSRLEVALKVFDASKCADNWRLMDELCLHQRCTHRNIVMYLAHFDFQNDIYLVHEFINGGTLFSKLQAERNGRLEESRAAKFAFQTSDALIHIHNMCFVHADVKPENILIDENDNIKLTDFGLCFPVGLSCERESEYGTPEYLAPEILCAEYFDTKIDIWSLGILIYEMLLGRTPFKNRSKPAMRRNIIAVRYKVPNFLGAEAKDVITKFLVRDPRDRLSLEAFQTHAWILKHQSSFYPEEASNYT